MDWNFSIGWVVAGSVILVAGGALVVFYKQVADNFAGGLADYQRVKLVGIITAIVGLIVMINLHTLILSWLVSVIFKQ